MVTGRVKASGQVGGERTKSLKKAGKRCPSTPKLGKTGLNGKEMMSQ